MRWDKTPWYHWLPFWFGLIVLGLLVVGLLVLRYISENIG